MARRLGGWTDEPEPEHWESAWEAFHDGVLLGAQLDRTTGTAVARVRLGFPKPPFAYSRHVRLEFDDVRFVTVYVWPRSEGAPVNQRLIETVSLEEFGSWNAAMDASCSEGYSVSSMSNAEYAVKMAFPGSTCMASVPISTARGDFRLSRSAFALERKMARR